MGQRIADGFDNLNDEERAANQPRICIAGDACHTHSAKAGQGMNVSMQDTFHLGWKLGSAWRGQAHPSLLHTYEHERKVTAQQLIDYDTRWSSMVGSRTRKNPLPLRRSRISSCEAANSPPVTVRTTNRSSPD